MASIDLNEFFEDLGKCNRIRKVYFENFGWRIDLNEIMHKLDPTNRNNNITHWSSDGCYLGETEVNHIFNVFRRDMKGLEELSIRCDDDDDHNLDADIWHVVSPRWQFARVCKYWS